MIGRIARYVSLRAATALVVAAALPVGLVAASALVSHPATPGHTGFTTPNQAGLTIPTASPDLSGLGAGATDTPDATETPEPTDTPDATETPEPTDTPDAAEAAASTARPTDNHGWLVSQAAEDESLVGGPNDNHGGYVSGIARGDKTNGHTSTCATRTHGESEGHCIAPAAAPSASPTPTATE